VRACQVCQASTLLMLTWHCHMGCGCASRHVDSHAGDVQAMNRSLKGIV
jgi:hypothetical protein